MKKISIIIPCYNVELYIDQCLDSIVNQSYRNIEIICINDGSDDGTLDRLNYISKGDSRIKILSQRNKGLSATRNIGVDASTGDYIMFVDSDDYLDIAAIEICAKFLQKRDLICFSYNKVYEGHVAPRKLGLNSKYEGHYIQRRMCGLIKDELADPSLIDSLVTACMKIYNAQILKLNNVSFTDTSLIGTEDLLYNLQYLEFVDSVEIIDLPLYNYRKTNDHSLTSVYKKDLFDKWRHLYNIIQKLIKNKSSEFDIALKNRICLSIIGLGLNELYSKEEGGVIRKNIRCFLADSLYRDAYRSLKLKHFPLHWKFFFFLAKYKMVVPLVWMLKIIRLKIAK